MDNSSLSETNINQIQKDAERLMLARQSSKDIPEKIVTEENTDNDDLSKYTHDADGVKVLNRTADINRKAIFHDLDRIKHWRESMDQTSPEISKNSTSTSRDSSGTIKEDPIMDKNIDVILNSLPSVESDGTSNDEAAAIKKLTEIENNLERKYSLRDS